MSDSPTPAAPLPAELRVHGVGGPQAVKILGEVDEHEIVTMPPFPVGDGKVLPRNAETRFAQRLAAAGAGTEAYEWGGLTTASAAKGLWVLYLPFTLVNAAGWAHGATRATAERGEVRRAIRVHLLAAHVTAFLATLTYVAWIGYLTLDLVARKWVQHVRAVDRPAGLTEDVILVWVPVIAPIVCAAVVVGLFLTPVRKGRFEDVREADPDIQPDRWDPVEPIGARSFFAHERSHARFLDAHRAVGLAGLAAALIQYFIGWNRLGAALLLLAAAQVVVLAILVVVDVVARSSWRPSEVFADELITDPNVHDAGSRFPAGATFAVLGSAIAHSAFAGLAMTLAPLLARWPEHNDGDALALGAELGATDILAWALVLLVGLSVAVFVQSAARAAPSATAAGKPPLVVRLARLAPRLGAAALLAFVVPVAVYIGLNVRAIVDEESVIDGQTGEVVRDCDGLRSVWCWYDTYEVDDDAVAKRLGSFVLLLLPGAVYAVLWRRHDTGLGRVVGNVWDVLTFWPRRFHPYGAPCSAERAVPELRARVRHVLDTGGDPGGTDGPGLVVVGHSQGSVLAAAAIASLPGKGAPALVTYGSPLGSLYAPTWPSYIPPLAASVRDRVAAASGMPWVNFWRATDPIGAAVPGAVNEELPDPQPVRVVASATVRAQRPLERPTRWGTVAGHGHYLADPDVQAAIRARRPDGGTP